MEKSSTNYGERSSLIFAKASFVALNIEPEDQSEDEVDDSKEIQVRVFSVV